MEWYTDNWVPPITAPTPSQQPPREAALGYTRAGHLSVIANAFSFAYRDFPKIRDEMAKSDTNNHLLNGLLFATITQFLHVLDAVAVFCQRHNPIDEFKGQKIYFDKYDFTKSANYSSLGAIQQAIIGMKFGGRDFVTLANDLKHRFPWIGLRSVSVSRGIADIFDEQKKVAIMVDIVQPLAGKIRDAIALMNESLPPSERLEIVMIF
jgi:hypothetical protein